MRAIVEFRDNSIIQIEKDPPLGEEIDLTGKYVFPIPDGTNLRINPNSIILPYIDPNSLVTQSFLAFLNNYPQYNNILFNPLITDTDMDQLNFSGILNIGTDSFDSRFQAGRGTGGPPSGTAPNSVALLPQNNSVVPPKPGILVTNTYDISTLTGGLGADNFTVYWQIYQWETELDIRAHGGLFNGQNIPSKRKLIEIDQEIGDLEVFISPNNGVDFFQAERLTSISLCSPTNQITIGFKNGGNAKLYIASYAILF